MGRRSEHQVDREGQAKGILAESLLKMHKRRLPGCKRNKNNSHAERHIESGATIIRIRQMQFHTLNALNFGQKFPIMRLEIVSDQ